MGIGIVLKQLINENNTNVNELSEQIGISPQTVYSIIKRDNMKADLDVLFRICDIFNVDINIFYNEYSNTSKVKNIDNQSNQKILEKYNILDVIDKAKIEERIDMLLEDEKYSSKKELKNV